MLDAGIVITAYKFVSPLSYEEARERLEILKRYLLPFEKELSSDTFREIFLSTFRVEELEVEDENTFFIILYNFLLRRSKGDSLLKEDEEYEIVKQYEHLTIHFPNIDPSHYREDVLRFFAKENRKVIESLLPEEIKEKIKKCSFPPYLAKSGNYLQIRCYSSKYKHPSLPIAHRREEEVKKLYPIAYLYFLSLEKRGKRE